MAYICSMLYSLYVLLVTSAIGADVTTAADEVNPTFSDLTLLSDNATLTTTSLLTTVSEGLVADISKEEATIINQAKKSFLEKLLEHMEPRIRPISREDNGPVKVIVDFHLTSISAVSETNMDYQIDLYLRQNWIDKRLAYNLTDLGADSKKGYVKLSQNPRGQIWIPDLFFPNERRASFHDVTVPNTMVKIYPSGMVYFSMRLTLVLSCKMDLYAFPLDTQSCPFHIESYSYETSELVLAWKSDPVTFDDDIDLPQFSLKTPLEIKVCTDSYSTGTFPCLEARFHMKRFFGYYLFQTYIPSALIVILSWVAFWINKDAIPARVSLSVVTVMTMVAQLAGSKSSIPSISYLKAVDVWMMMGMVFVFAGLIEYAIVNSLDRRAKHRKLKQAAASKISNADGHETGEKKLKKELADRVDEACRFVFPLAFILFNVIYWPYYTRG